MIKTMAQQIRQLQPILYGDGLEIPVELPRNLNLEYIELLPDIVNMVLVGGAKPAYVANTLVRGVRLTYKGKQFYFRTGIEIRELMELQGKVVPDPDYWSITPESRFKGSESNFCYVQFETIANSTTGAPTAIQCVLNIVIHIAQITFNKIADYRGFWNFAAGAGVFQYQIPADNQSIQYVLVQVTDTTLTDIDDSVIIVQNVQSGVELIRDTWYNLRIQYQKKWGYVHNAGLLVIPINVRQNQKESYTVQYILNTAGAAVIVTLLVVTQV